MNSRFTSVIMIVLVAGAAGCGSATDGPALLKELSPETTGITFTNTITPSDTLNNLNYPFTYHGGGVASGDINNDGLPDLFFTGNMSTSRLYLNKGNMQFEDITESAGVRTDRWATGVSMVDINNDGLLDIYVCAVSTDDAPEAVRANLLFINNGDTTFTESAARYNIDDTSFTTHAAFLDYDRDGDLDLFLLNHHPGLFARNNAVRPASSTPYGQITTSYDKLYRNDGRTFTEVSEEAGIVRRDGFGLGVAVADVNRDGWPDIYVSNDVITNDVLYINNQDGSFSDRTAKSVKHSSFAGMGIDIADFNNDGWPDIFQTEMMPDDLQLKKTMSGGISYDHYLEMRAKGYLHQYPLNTLQLSNGIDRDGDVIFSEVARMAGVAYTNWSWSALFGDYDNDGRKDIMVTNGFPKAINNYDFLTEINQIGRFGTAEIIQQKRRKLFEKLQGYNVPNHIFRNNGDLIFEDKSKSWNFDKVGFSYGASQADLDNDGDLDIAINNINAPATVYQNQADTLTDNHFLSIKLKGATGNMNGVGTKVIVTAGHTRQHKYLSPYRGYQSTQDNRLLFGLGNAQTVDSLEVIWPDQRYQLLTNVGTDRQMTLDYTEAREEVSPNRNQNKEQLFTEAANEYGIHFRHQENQYDDYDVQGLLPYQLSTLGPALATGDVNGDGLDDFFVGGSAGYAGTLFIQNEHGTFQKSESEQPWITDRNSEDVDAAFFDADSDGDQDLYVVSGGYEFSPASRLLQDRLYINRGDGSFVKSRSVLPQMLTSGSVVKPADYDTDADIDLFVGGRQVPRRYPYPPKSYLLRNDNGTYVDVTDELIPGIRQSGMITDAEWIDFDGDEHLDLVTAGEWQPIRFYKNNGASFLDVTAQWGDPSQTGWWRSLESGDFDNDGDPDLVAGNLGLNHTYRASDEQPFEVFAADFDKNQSMDLIFAIEKNGVHVPLYGRAKMAMKIPPIKDKFMTYQGYAEADVAEIVGETPMNEALHLQATTFASSYLENRGPEGFEITPLPNHAQLSVAQDLLATDINGDDNLDLLLVGNMYNTEPQTPRHDAGNGTLLVGNGKGSFKSVSIFESGFLTPLDARNMKMISVKETEVIIVANNDGKIQFFTRKTPE